jgi:hypothetical protein
MMESLRDATQFPVKHQGKWVVALAGFALPLVFRHIKSQDLDE